MNYSKIYNQLISRAQNRELTCYTEKHHIIPKCMGGGDKIENIAVLTAREHFLAHKLLVEIYPNNYELLWALWLMAIGKKRMKSSNPYKVTGREYEKLKIRFSESRKKPITKHHKRKIAKANGKKVIQYDFEGNIINTFNSAMDSERFITNNSLAHWKDLQNNIDACCRLNQKSAYGFIWKYEGDLLHLGEHKGSSNKGKNIKYKNKIYKTAIEFKKQNNISNYMFTKMINEKTIKYVS